jgi:hypothetical protein
MNRPAQQTEKKKPYEAPKLLVYGKLVEMTQSSGKTGNSDGPPPPRAPNRFTGRSH